jgi:hypothetical protein
MPSALAHVTTDRVPNRRPAAAATPRRVRLSSGVVLRDAGLARLLCEEEEDADVA